jgi:hypothetical protein
MNTIISNFKIYFLSAVKPLSRWRTLLGNLLKRQFKPLFDPIFVLYFFIFIIGIGAAGVWLEYFEYQQLEETTIEARNALLFALATYSIVLSAASLAELFLRNSEEQDEVLDKDIRFAHLCLGVVAVIGSLSTFFDQSAYSFEIQLSATALSLILWWQVNFNNPNFSNPRIIPGNAKGCTEFGDASEDDGGYQINTDD